MDSPRSPRPKITEAERIVLPSMPDAGSLAEWRRTMISRVSAASGRGEAATAWLAEVDSQGSQVSDFEVVPPKWASLDAKLQAALREIIKGDLAVRVGTMMDARV